MKRFAWNALILLVCPLIFVVLQGCSSREPKPVEYSLYSIADADLNRDAGGRPLSVVLAVYQLRDPSQFARLTFDQYVSSSDTVALFGDSVISRDEVVVLPASRERVQLALLPDAVYIGIVALYRSPAAQHWHYLVPADQLRETGFWPFSRQKVVSIQLHECHLDVSGVVVDPIPGQRINVEPVCDAKFGERAGAVASGYLSR